MSKARALEKKIGINIYKLHIHIVKNWEGVSNKNATFGILHLEAHIFCALHSSWQLFAMIVALISDRSQLLQTLCSCISFVFIYLSSC